MAKMSAAKRRELELEDYQAPTLPQKTVQPVAQPVKATGLLAPASAPAAAQQAPAGMNAAQFLQAIQPNPSRQRSDVALKALGEFAGFGGDPMSADSRAAIQDIIGGNASGKYYAHEGGVNYAPELHGSLTYNQQLLDSLNGYTFNPTSDTERKGYNVSAPDGRTQTINWGDKRSSFDKFMEKAIPIGLGLLAGGAAGLFGPVGGAGAAAGGGAVSGAAAAGAAEIGALGLAESVYGIGGAMGAGAVPGTVGGLAGSTAAFGGLGSVLPAGVGYGSAAGALAGVADFGAGADLAPSMGDFGGIDAFGQPSITQSLAGGIEPFVPQLPTIGAEATAFGGLPELSALATGAPVDTAFGSFGSGLLAPEVAAPSAFNPAKDSQAYNADNNITQPVNTTPPKTVNLGQFDNPAYSGGTMGTAGGLQGAFDVAKQAASDLMTTPNAVTGQGGGLLGSAASWMKANPTLGRLLLSGASGLLSGSGGGSSGAPQTPAGPPVQWNSNLQQGLLSPVQQYAPPPVVQNRPAGLLAQGYANDGAWRYLKG